MTAPIDPVDVMARLDGYALELDARSKELHVVEQELDPLRAWHEHEIDAVTVRLFEEYRAGELRAFPSEQTRKAITEHEIVGRDGETGTKILGRLAALHASRKRLQRRIEHLQSATSASQSVLAALRVEQEIVARTGGPNR